MKPLFRPLATASAAALLAGCVPQGGPSVGLQPDVRNQEAAGTSKVDAEVQRIFAVAGLDPDDPQKAKPVDRQAVGTVLAVRSGGRKVGMAVARLGRDQIVLQDPEAVARLLPDADQEKLSRSLGGVIPTTGTVGGARISFDRRHLALDIEADRSSPATLLASAPLPASRFVPSGRVGEPIPADVVASIRAGRDPVRTSEPRVAENAAAGLPQPSAAQPQPAGRSIFASLFDAPPVGAAPAAAPTAAVPVPVAEPAQPPASSEERTTGLRVPPALATYASGPAVVTVEDDFYASARPGRAGNAMAYAPAASSAPHAAGLAAEPDREPPASPTVRRW
ncbi:hypothetical protein [Methylobacterium fujisawaense]|jgi:hypothetical protein